MFRQSSYRTLEIQMQRLCGIVHGDSGRAVALALFVAFVIFLLAVARAKLVVGIVTANASVQFGFRFVKDFVAKVTILHPASDIKNSVDCRD